MTPESKAQFIAELTEWLDDHYHLIASSPADDDVAAEYTDQIGQLRPTSWLLTIESTALDPDVDIESTCRLWSRGMTMSHVQGLHMRYT